VPIELLSELVISQIAAGEVVERPSSVAKELLENALDAGAKTILVDVQEGGRRLIRVSDDGAGIPSHEARLAITRHATSKLRTADDLFAITTLGFRGEALASIVAVSQTTIVTRHRQENVGVELRIEGGVLLSERGIGVPAGTVITVENLFYNTPARLKFLKSDNTEKRQIAQMVMDYAMAYPNVRFVLVQDGREVFRTAGSGQLADVVVKVFGLDVFKQMIDIYGEETVQHTQEKLTVQGFVSLPEQNRNDRSRIILFVNGRAVQDNHLLYGITQAYHMLMEKGRYPYVVLMLQVPPDFVDVNVHPTKAEVRFQDANLTFVVVQRAIREQLVRHVKPTHAHNNTPPPPRKQSSTTWDAEPQQMNFGLNVPQTAPQKRSYEADDMSDEDLQAIPEGLGRPSKPRTLPILRVVGQVAGSYIVAEGPAGMYLFDQYACHERVLFDDLVEMAQQGDALESHVIDSVTVDIGGAKLRFLEPFIAPLTRYGLDLETFGSNTVMVRAIPSFITPQDAPTLVQRIVLVLGEGGDFETTVLGCLSQIGAVKTGQTLQPSDMQTIIRKLERSPSPFVSPSGRQTLLHLSAEQLAKEFGKRT